MKPSEAYFLAKREVQDKLDGRLSVLREKLESLPKECTDFDYYDAITSKIKTEIAIVENIRSHFRNTMLWDTSKGE
jgi:hypothetical protein